MIKRTIKETVSEYDSDGKLIKQTITETTEDDDTIYYSSYPIQYPTIYGVEPTCVCNTSKEQ